MPTILERPVSVFAHVRATIPAGKAPLGEILSQIQDGTSARRIAELREAKPLLSEEAYKAKKAKLRCFTPCCTLRTRDKDVAMQDKLLSVTGMVHLDFDHLEDLAATRAHLLQEPSLVFCFVSPSGDGLKVGFAATGIVDRTPTSMPGARWWRPWRRVIPASRRVGIPRFRTSMPCATSAMIRISTRTPRPCRSR